MTDHTPEDHSAAVAALWEKLSDERVGLLWVKGAGQEPQPMTLYADSDTGSVWFITSVETDLFSTVAEDSEAGLSLQADQNAYIATLTGKIAAVDDDEKLDEIWSLPAGAWFEKGREDPKIRLLRFVPSTASVWASQRNSVLVGLKLVASGLTEGASDPDVGTHHVFRLDAAA